MFVRKGWYVAAALHEVSGRPLARTLLNDAIVIFRTLSGEICALEDRCRHRGAPLSLGEVTENGIRCGYHGMEYNGLGRCTGAPENNGHIPERSRIRRYPVVASGDFLWIWMGNAEEADPGLIVAEPPQDENWKRVHDMLHIKCSYVLVLENLMDLSHLSYLHKNSIGSSADDSANATMEIERTPTGVKFIRLMCDAEAPPMWRARFQDYPDRIDRWSEFEYVAPCSVQQYTGAVSAGEYGEPSKTPCPESRALHAVTPETETTCFYFFSVSNADPQRVGTPDAKFVTAVFKEDAFMLEGQQLRLNGFDSSKLLSLRSDMARVQMYQALNERIKEEEDTHVKA